MMKIAVFGAGRIGQIHAANAAAHPDIELKYIVEPVARDLAERLAAQTGAILANADAVFADQSIDGVIIASSTNSHAELLIRAADTKKAVFCEKPISLDFALTREVMEKVEASGIACMLGFQRRYDASFAQVHDRILSGASGELEHLTMQSRDPSPPPVSYVKTSGGMFRDSTIHDMDMARYLLKEEIETVYAVGSCLISDDIGAVGDVDTLMVMLKTVSGRLAQITACRRGPMGYDQRLEALCADEVLYVENRPETMVTIARPDGAYSAPPMNYFLKRFAQAYRDEINGFVALMRDGTTGLADIRDGYEAQRLVEAAIVSARTGQPVKFGASWTPEAASI